jgi:hypothetical protein
MPSFVFQSNEVELFNRTGNNDEVCVLGLFDQDESLLDRKRDTKAQSNI